jgi:putative ATPase
VIAPLLSRSRVFVLNELSPEEMTKIIKRTKVKIDKKALEWLVAMANGDARQALTMIDATRELYGSVTLESLKETLQSKTLRYDKKGEEHYNTISAFIKSMRASQPDAAIYYLAKMLYAGEDPRFIARRIVICAAEDVGLADPQALILANAAMQVSEFIGLPEARIPLAQAVIYIACAPKSNSAYLSINKAMADVAESKTLPVPENLKDSHYKGAEKLGHGQGYQYAHDFENHVVKQDYLTEKKKFYVPTEQGFEKTMKQYLDKLENLLNKK